MKDKYWQVNFYLKHRLVEVIFTNALTSQIAALKAEKQVQSGWDTAGVLEIKSDTSAKVSRLNSHRKYNTEVEVRQV